jgi:hypothetical protein
MKSSKPIEFDSAWSRSDWEEFALGRLFAAEKQSLARGRSLALAASLMGRTAFDR